MEEDIQNVETEPTQQNSVNEVKAKTYSQDEVNKIVADRLARERKKQPQQQPTTDLSGYKKTIAQMSIAMARMEKQMAQSKFDISPEYMDYVDYVVSHKTNQDTSYDKALADFMENDGKRYLRNIATPRPQNQGGTQMDDEEAYFFKKYGKRLK